MMVIEDNLVKFNTIQWDLFDVICSLMNKFGGIYSNNTLYYLNKVYFKGKTANIRMEVIFPIEKLDLIKRELIENHGDIGEYLDDSGD